jgi:hypothetical protein
VRLQSDWGRRQDLLGNGGHVVETKSKPMARRSKEEGFPMHACVCELGQDRRVNAGLDMATA